MQKQTSKRPEPGFLRSGVRLTRNLITTPRTYAEAVAVVAEILEQPKWYPSSIRNVIRKRNLTGVGVRLVLRVLNDMKA